MRRLPESWRGWERLRSSAETVRRASQAENLLGISAKLDAQRGKLPEVRMNALSVRRELQRQPQGAVRPESFSHGSSAQRVSWFKRGVAAGRMADCNTSDAKTL